MQKLRRTADECGQDFEGRRTIQFEVEMESESTIRSLVRTV